MGLVQQGYDLFFNKYEVDHYISGLGLCSNFTDLPGIEKNKIIDEIVLSLKNKTDKIDKNRYHIALILIFKPQLKKIIKKYMKIFISNDIVEDKHDFFCLMNSVFYMLTSEYKDKDEHGHKAKYNYYISKKMFNSFHKILSKENSYKKYNNSKFLINNNIIKSEHIDTYIETQNISIVKNEIQSLFNKEINRKVAIDILNGYNRGDIIERNSVHINKILFIAGKLKERFDELQ